MSGFSDPFARRPAAPAPVDPYGPGQGGTLFSLDLGPITTTVPSQRKDGNFAPKVSFEIYGDPEGRRRDAISFTLAEDVRQLYDPWSITLPNPEGKYNYLLNSRMRPIRIYHSDPAVQGGEEIPVLRGIIVCAEQTADENGTLLTLEGYDLGWLLTSCAPFWVDIKNLQWAALAAALLDRTWGLTLTRKAGQVVSVSQLGEWGFRSITGVNINDRVKRGRVDAEVAKLNQEISDLKRVYAGKQEIVQARTTNIKALTPRIQTQPGETVADVLTRMARLSRRFVGVSALGDLMLWTPDYKQEPVYTFEFHHRAPDSLRNNLKSAKYRIDGEPVYNDVACVGSRIYPIILPNQDDPNEGKFAGRYRDMSVGGLPLQPGAQGPVFSFLRLKAFADAERYTGEMARIRARWAFDQGLYEGETWTAVAQGHSLAGQPFVAGTRARVRDSKNGLDKVMYVAQVQRSITLQGGATSTIVCKPDGLLGP